MNKAYFEIKDNCRKGLLKYLSKAISVIPAIERPMILDAGCGSGVPTLLLVERFKGHVTAIDSDTKSINRLEEKVKELNLSHRINLCNCSLFDVELKERQYDLIIAEGLLNVVGFEKGFLRILKLLKREGHIIIHDEFKNHNKKIEFIENKDCEILDSFILDEQIWWNDYYRCLEKEISSYSNEDLLKLFKSDMFEIESYKRDSSGYKSIYYVIRKK